MIDKYKLEDDLVRGFIEYQYRLENPMTSPTETEAVKQAKYMTDPIFHAKVDSIVAFIMHIIWKHEKRG